MDIVLLGAAGLPELWYALPLIVVVSLVYAATRHEAMGPIVRHALGCGAWIVGLLAAVLVLLAVLSRRL